MKRIIYIVIFLVSFTSCNDYLDVEPKGQIIANSLEDYEFLLSSTSFYNVTGFPFILSDDFFSTTIPLAAPDNYAAFLWEDYFYNSTEDDINWNLEYEKIFLANTIVEGVNELGANTLLGKQIKAEALFHRSYTLFSLVNTYAKHYNAATAATDPGVPIFLETNLETDSYTRSSVKDVYDLIISDMEAIVDDLPDSQDNKVRPDIASGYGFLSRVYLYKGEFEKAKNAANVALSYNDRFHDLREEPFASTFQDYKEGYINKTISWGFVLMKISPETKEEVYSDPTDLRFSQNFYDFGPTSLIFRGYVASFHGPSTPEMYLIKAEVDARTNNIEGALENINTVREYRFMEADYAPITQGEVTDVFDLLISERRKELMFKGHRWFDVKRWNAEGLTNISFERKDVEGNIVATLPANDDNWVIAIPRKVISDYNPSLEQNPR
ncbi:RagB/SusD family nutrient uptake outer membrane protein [Winogradskyella bathintestinalis]|uniref:RagB/SusD family nutrient uptake outer membrane protein n=1 Tax=Winogradskyella bathintestinalis TaxID=3035208 RepID=A0ABT7ZXB9_9FLAO|nr:RagB/SusD family nutrient uptake outer membrane protein [Winogradskyella bathintestinalis]MDN3493388.1 RagB/SusD family nutrient uptake outer membrane protein [Winogradskyella bathintestinalis]